MSEKLFDLICLAKINESLYEITHMIFEELYEELYEILINVCAHIGTFLSIYDSYLWIETLDDLNNFIHCDKIIIKDVYVLITKLCIICDINIQKPVIASGKINIKTLRTKVIDLFEVTNWKISDEGISKYLPIMPSANSDTYPLVNQIITGYVYSIKELERLGIDNTEIETVSNKLRNSIDYIIRKKYNIENKIYPNDNDCIWFLWSYMLYIHDSPEIKLLYEIFRYKYMKKCKLNRIGILHGAFLIVVYNMKKDISRKWNKKEHIMLTKIEDISMDLFRNMKDDIVIHKDDICENDGLDYMFNFIPTVNENLKQVINQHIEEKKVVKCKDTKCF